MLFFWLGFKLRQNGTETIRRIPIVVWLLSSVALFVLKEYLGNFEAIFLKMLTIGVSLVSHIIGALMAFVVLQKIAGKVNWHNKYFVFLSKRSMVVYLFHQQVIYLFIG